MSSSLDCNFGHGACDCVTLLLGAILVFLPGYDEIITLRDRIQDEKRFSDSSRSVAYNC